MLVRREEMSHPMVDALLEQRHARRIGKPGSPSVARGRLSLSRSLWHDYAAFARLRRGLAAHEIRSARLPAPGRRIVRRLSRAGLLVEREDGYRYRSQAAKRYVMGGWLEELAYCAMVDAGADEAYFAQKIGWTVDEANGENEIDVLARRGGTLSFVSCKTASPFYSGNRRLFQKIEDSIFEAHYWDEHFANGDGRAVLLISTDLVDEARSAARSQTLFARAQVLDVHLVGRDFFTYDKLVETLREHW